MESAPISVKKISKTRRRPQNVARTVAETVPTCVLSDNAQYNWGKWRTSRPSFSYVRACCSTEMEFARWVRRRSSYVVGPDWLLTDGHFATVDVVHLVRPHGRLCLSGSRDRTISIWDINQLHECHNSSSAFNPNDSRLCTQEQAHKGWIWCLTTVEDVVYSGGWDCHVNQWQLTPTGLQSLSSTRVDAAVLSLIAESDLILTSSFDNKVTLLDPRNRHSRIAQLQYHRGPVLSMVKGDYGSPYIFTCGQDKRVFCIDRRTWTPVMQRDLTNYAHCLCFAEHQLWAATQGGTLELLDPYSHGLPSIVERPVSPYPTVVRQVQHSLGGMLCISRDRKMRIFSPGIAVDCIAELGPFPNEPGRFDYVNGNLSIAFGDGSIGVWKNRWSDF